jgi:diguanylate cyclase (GGDEF)-like protein/PAS domain S-box-containing protein
VGRLPRRDRYGRTGPLGWGVPGGAERPHGHPRTFSPADVELLSFFATQAAIAIRNARLYEETRRRAERLAVVNRIARAVGATLNLDDLMETVYQEVSSIFQADAFFIALYDQETNELDYRLRVDEGIRELRERQPLGIGLTSLVVSEKKPILIRDFEKEKDHLPEVKLWGTMKAPPSWLGVPMQIGDRVVGVISVQAYRPHAYGEEEQLLLCTIADQVAVAMENARLFEEARRRAEELHLLFEVTNDVSASLKLDEVLERIATHLCLAAKATSGHILILDESGKRATVRAQYWSPEASSLERTPDVGTVYDLTRHPAILQALRESRPLITHVDDPDLDPATREMMADFDGRSALRIPIQMTDVLRGYALIWESRRRREWTDEEIRLCQTLASQAAIAIENARLYEEAQRRLSREKKLNELACALGGELELDKIIPRLLPLAAELTGADAGSVALFDPHRQAITYPYHYNLPEELAGVEVMAGSGLAGYTMKVRRPVLLDDYRQHPAALQPWVEAGVRSVLGVPLVAGDEVVGALGLFSLGEVRPFGPEVVAAAKAAAGLAAVVIQRAWLFQAERRQRRDAEALREAALALTSALDRNQVIERILSQLEQVVPYDSSSVQLLQGDKLVIIGGRGFPNLEEILGISFPVDGDNPNREVMRTLSPFILEDAPAVYEAFSQEPFAAIGIRSWLGVPMLIGERPVGMITLDKCQPGFYTQEHARLAQAFAAQAAIAIENAHLFEEARQRVAELEALRRSSLQLTSSLDLPAVLDSIAESALSLVGSTDCHIYLYDEESETFTFGTALWEDGRREAAVKAPRRDGLTATVAREGRTIVINDAVHHPLYTTPEAREWGVQAIAGFPLKRAGRVLGVFTIAFLKPHTFSEGELRVLGLLADQAAIAIENARLFEETERLKTFNESIVQGVTEAILMEDAQGILTFANPAAEELLGYTREELIGQHWTTIVPEDEREKVHQETAKRPVGIASRYETALLSKEGKVIPVIVSARPLFEEGKFVGVLSALTDITERKRAEEQLAYMATHDPLTGVPNRRGFFTLAEQQLKMADRMRRGVLLLFVDFDDLKRINDAFGHAEGDRALIEIADVLRGTFRESDIIGRIGGDEFVVLAMETDEGSAEVLATRLQKNLEARNARGDLRYKLSLSVGVVRYDPENPCSIDELLTRADRAMYERKQFLQPLNPSQGC